MRSLRSPADPERWLQAQDCCIRSHGRALVDRACSTELPTKGPCLTGPRSDPCLTGPRSDPPHHTQRSHCIAFSRRLRTPRPHLPCGVSLPRSPTCHHVIVKLPKGRYRGVGGEGPLGGQRRRPGDEKQPLASDASCGRLAGRRACERVRKESGRHAAWHAGGAQAARQEMNLPSVAIVWPRLLQTSRAPSMCNHECRHGSPVGVE